jgi:hypothetical protein
VSGGEGGIQAVQYSPNLKQGLGQAHLNFLNEQTPAIGGRHVEFSTLLFAGYSLVWILPKIVPFFCFVLILAQWSFFLFFCWHNGLCGLFSFMFPVFYVPLMRWSLYSNFFFARSCPCALFSIM